MHSCLPYVEEFGEISSLQKHQSYNAVVVFSSYEKQIPVHILNIQLSYTITIVKLDTCAADLCMVKVSVHSWYKQGGRHRLWGGSEIL